MRYVAQRLGLLVVFGCVLFGAAGRLDWARAWGYLLTVSVLEFITLILLAILAPETLNRRGAPGAGVKPFDRVFAVLYLVLSLCTAAMAGLDAVRFGWSRLPVLLFPIAVVASGPYRIVRHPGYLAFILGALATPAMLGSAWTFVPAGLLVLLFVVRTYLEDDVLRRELPGYEEYSRRTRFRLVPLVW